MLVGFTFFTASLFFSFLSLFNSDFNSNISPFLVVVKYLLSVILMLGFSKTQMSKLKLNLKPNAAYKKIVHNIDVLILVTRGVRQRQSIIKLKYENKITCLQILYNVIYLYIYILQVIN